MLDYARQRLTQLLGGIRSLVFITCGPAGVQADELPCEAVAGVLYVLLPQSSDHLFNLEQDLHVTLLSPRWELKGRAYRVEEESQTDALSLLRYEAAAWCVLLRIEADVVQVRHEKGWGYNETFDVAYGGPDV